jgi:nitroreductase
MSITMSITMSKKSTFTDHPFHELLAERWSPYAFQDRPVSEADLCSLFEAARWSASSYDEQPWSYLVATKENPKLFQQLLLCLN